MLQRSMVLLQTMAMHFSWDFVASQIAVPDKGPGVLKLIYKDGSLSIPMVVLG